LCFTSLIRCCYATVDTTIAELIKEITDSDDFMNSLAVEQGTILVYCTGVYIVYFSESQWLLLLTSVHCWNNKFYLVPCIHLTKLLFVPRVCTCFGSRSFAVAAPTIWTPFLWPFAVVFLFTVFGANSKLFYNLAIQPPWRHTPASASDLAGHCVLYKFIYLLTYLFYFKLV